MTCGKRKSTVLGWGRSKRRSHEKREWLFRKDRVTVMKNKRESAMYGTLIIVVLSSSRTSVRVKLGLFNAKIRNENRRYIHRLIYQLNEQDLLCHSI